MLRQPSALLTGEIRRGEAFERHRQATARRRTRRQAGPLLALPAGGGGVGGGRVLSRRPRWPTAWRHDDRLRKAATGLARAARGGIKDARHRQARVAGSQYPGPVLEATAAADGGSASRAEDGQRGSRPAVGRTCPAGISSRAVDDEDQRSMSILMRSSGRSAPRARRTWIRYVAEPGSRSAGPTASRGLRALLLAARPYGARAGHGRCRPGTRTSGKPTASRLSARCSHHGPVRDKNLLNTERDGVSRLQRGGQPSASKTVIGSRLAVDRSRRRSPGTGARRPGPGPGRARSSLPASRAHAASSRVGPLAVRRRRCPGESRQRGVPVRAYRARATSAAGWWRRFPRCCHARERGRPDHRVLTYASDVVEVVETYVYLLFMSVVTVARRLQSGPA